MAFIPFRRVLAQAGRNSALFSDKKDLSIGWFCWVFVLCLASNSTVIFLAIQKTKFLSALISLVLFYLTRSKKLPSSDNKKFNRKTLHSSVCIFEQPTPSLLEFPHQCARLSWN